MNSLGQRKGLYRRRGGVSVGGRLSVGVVGVKLSPIRVGVGVVITVEVPLITVEAPPAVIYQVDIVIFIVILLVNCLIVINCNQAGVGSNTNLGLISKNLEVVGKIRQRGLLYHTKIFVMEGKNETSMLSSMDFIMKGG